jgi:hypothetical protein
MMYAVAIVGTAILGYAIYRSFLEMKLIILFCLALFAVSMARPLESNSMPQWHAFLIDFVTRYWYLPALAFAWAIAACTLDKEKWIRVSAKCLLALTVIGVCRTWVYDAYPPSHSTENAAVLANAPAGSDVTLKIFPEPWTMVLHKKAEDKTSSRNQ